MDLGEGCLHFHAKDIDSLSGMPVSAIGLKSFRVGLAFFFSISLVLDTLRSIFLHLSFLAIAISNSTFILFTPAASLIYFFKVDFKVFIFLFYFFIHFLHPLHCTRSTNIVEPQFGNSFFYKLIGW